MGSLIPSVGRVVHFCYGDRHVPALIIDPNPANPDGLPGTDVIEIQVFTGFEAGHFPTLAPYDASGVPASWHWPEYVAPRPGP